MPGPIDGVGVYEVAKKQHPDLPAIFFSGYSQPERINEILQTDPNARFFQKPAPFGEIKESMEYLLASKG